MYFTVALVFMSCSKEQINPINSSNGEPFLGKAAGTHTYLDNGDPDGIEGEDYGCFAGGHNCLDEVEIVTTTAHIINDIGDESDAGNNQGVIDLVRINKNLLKKVVDTSVLDLSLQGNASLLDAVLNGDMTLTVRG